MAELEATAPVIRAECAATGKEAAICVTEGADEQKGMAGQTRFKLELSVESHSLTLSGEPCSALWPWEVQRRTQSSSLRAPPNKVPASDTARPK